MAFNGRVAAGNQIWKEWRDIFLVFAFVCEMNMFFINARTNHVHDWPTHVSRVGISAAGITIEN